MLVAWRGPLGEKDVRRVWPDLERTVVNAGDAIGLAVGGGRTSLHAARDVAVATDGPPWGPSAESIAEAYARHGDDLGRYVPGEFTTVVADFRRGVLLGLSSATTPRLLSYCEIPGGVLVSDRVLELARHPAVPRELDEQSVLRRVIGVAMDPAATTALRGVRRLRAGEGILASRDAIRVRRVDRLRPRRDLSSASLDDSIEAFWSVLRQAACTRRSAAGAPCLSFSGGIDSTATRVALGGGPPIKAFALVGSPETRLPPPEGTSVEWIDASHAGDLSELERLPLRDDPPLAPMAFVPAQLRLWRAMRAAGYDTAFEGEGGDELFELCVHPLDALRRGHFGTALAVLRGEPEWRPLLWRGFVLPHLPRVARAPWFRRWESRGDWLPGYLVRGRESDARVRRALRDVSEALVHRTYTDAIDAWLSSPWRVGVRCAYEDLARACGVELATPLTDRGVIELALGISPRWMLAPGLDKAFLRRALRGHVPDAVRLLPKDTRLDRELEPEMLLAPWTRDVLADVRVRQRLVQWVRFPIVDRILDDAARGHRLPPRQTWRLQSLVAFAQWYRRASREYGVD